MTEKDNIEKTTVKTWQQLISIVNEYAIYPDYIFRGQAQNDWLLESTLSRVLKKIKEPKKEELVTNHFNNFKLSIRGRRGSNPTILEDNEMWALGQHFGLHTPLLDWSQSPFVAMFFALTSLEKSATGYRTLWALHSSSIGAINAWYKKEKKIEKKVELINPFLDENYRLVNQNGIFTKIDIDTDIEEWVYNCSAELKGVTLQKIDFPDKIRDEALKYLDLMNINYSSLFPDLFGGSMDSNIKLEQTDYLKKRQDDQWKKS